MARSIPVVRLTDSKIYQSYTEAAQNIDIHPTTIRRAVKKNWTVKGHYFIRYVDWIIEGKPTKERKQPLHPKDRLGRLVLISRTVKMIGNHNRSIWLCKCDCGRIVTIVQYHLKSGHSKSCGCLRKEVSKQLCLNSRKTILQPGDKYGRLTLIEEFMIRSKGINGKISQWWLCRCSCGNLKKIRGTDIINNATRSCGCLMKEVSLNNIQLIHNSQRNRSWFGLPFIHGFLAKLIQAFGENKSTREWSEDKRCVVSFTALAQRLRKGWEPERAITTPSQKAKKINPEWSAFEQNIATELNKVMKKMLDAPT